VLTVNGVAETDHFMKCPGCGEWFDMRDLGQVFTHVHNQGIEISERVYLHPLT
jgi:CRISPR/Cas system type I-B associated protein Csh2 (Cas7 group RAMP superfamily)